MFKLIETLRAKPSDRNIRIIRVVFAIILLGVIYFGFSKTTWEFSNIPKEVLYALYLFPFIGLIRGIFDPGIMRRKLWKWTQVTLWGLMLILSWFFIETDTGGSVSVAKIVDTDFWIWFFGFWLLLAGLTIASKNITLKNERYGEKVTKIRV